MRIFRYLQTFFLLPQIKEFFQNHKFSNRLSRSVPATNKMVYTFDYEVYGKVQGVFFRKYTKQEADKLHIRGFVQNTDRDTVIGKAESDKKESLGKFKNFLQNVGSPASRIDKCVITNEQVNDAFTFDDFSIKK